MIDFIDVSKLYGGWRGQARITALRSVSLRVERGRTAAVVGPNGAGKSTLLALALGFLQPTSGEVLLNGMPPRVHVRRNGAGYLPERLTLPAEWRVFESLRAFAQLDGVSSTDSARLVRQAIDRFGLGPYDQRSIGTLSRGLLQRLGLAQAALARRDVVVLDEPTEALDPHGRVLFREIAAELRMDGITVMVASHDLGELERIADVVLLIENGRVLETFEPRQSAERNTWTLRLAAVVPFLRDLFPDAVQLATDAAEPRASDGSVAFAVTAADAADLNARLAALIGGGAVILEVMQRSDSLEERVRRTLDTPPHRASPEPS